MFKFSWHTIPPLHTTSRQTIQKMPSTQKQSSYHSALILTPRLKNCFTMFTNGEGAFIDLISSCLRADCGMKFHPREEFEDARKTLARTGKYYCLIVKTMIRPADRVILRRPIDPLIGHVIQQQTACILSSARIWRGLACQILRR